MMVQQSRYAFLLAALMSAPLADSAPFSPATSPYADYQNRPLKALSEKEIAGYLAGEGMGMALAAELNRYPGPKHALEMAEDLALTAQQRYETQKLFKRMQKEAQTIGRILIKKERELDRLFHTQAITEENLKLLTKEIGALRGQVRYAHLQAHLAMHEILSVEQRQIYQKQRGYPGQPHPPAQHPPTRGGSVHHH